MRRNKITFISLATGLLLCLFLLLRNSSLFWTVASSEFRNIKLNGKVIDKTIHKELYEKTHTILLYDSTRYVLPNKDLDDSVEIGDSIFKERQDYKIILFKGSKLNNKIVFVLPYAE